MKRTAIGVAAASVVALLAYAGSRSLAAHGRGHGRAAPVDSPRAEAHMWAILAANEPAEQVAG